jgi:cytochrome c peroxidase
MGRLAVVVLVLLAVALLANRYLLRGGDPAPQGFLEADGPQATVEGAGAQAPPQATPAAPPAEAVAASSDATAAAAPAAAADVASASNPPTTDAGPGIDMERIRQAVRAAGELESETVLLGTPSLTTGIPGSGALTVAEVEAWLAEPRNHVTLQPELPLGLAEGASAITGIDANPLTRAKIELGRQLYFDTRLSSDNTVSCASCHDPAFGYAKDTQFGVGVQGQQGNRNSPVAYNRIVSGAQFWDGRADSLEAQAVGPIANPIEMGNTHAKCVEILKGIPGYAAQFAAIFPDGVTIDNVGRAIATFERAIVTGPAPWDYQTQLRAFETAYAADLEDLPGVEQDDPELYAEYQRLKADADAHPLGASALRGGELFFSDKGGCTACHVGANFADEKYHNLGVGMQSEGADAGRFSQTSQESDRGAFKTPTVRNVALTAPYMHDGSLATLEEVVEWYDKGGHANPSLSEKVKKLNLTAQEKADLVAFMKEGLTGALPPVESGRLPD